MFSVQSFAKFMQLLKILRCFVIGAVIDCGLILFYRYSNCLYVLDLRAAKQGMHQTTRCAQTFAANSRHVSTTLKLLNSALQYIF